MTLHAHVALDTLNTFGLAATTRWQLVLDELSDLTALIENPDLLCLPRLVLGGGSNLLLREDFKGLVIQNRLHGIELNETSDAWLLHVAAGENWHDLIAWTLDKGMAGMENLALIPGCMGAAPVQNIGAYGAELAQFCTYVDYIDLDAQFDGEPLKPQRINAADCQFGYRESIFKHQPHSNYLIVAVGLALPKKWQPNLSYGPLAALGENVSAKQIFDTVCATRMAKLPDPKQLGNAGSFFKNPICSLDKLYELRQDHPNIPSYPADGGVKVAAGWLIDQCGLKGFKLGGAMVHRDQALVLVNADGASAQDIIELARRVCDEVKAKFGLQLEPEVRLIGAMGELNWADVLA